MIPAELQQPILDRAGGNPLYAEEFVRLLKDRGLLVERGSSWELQDGAEVPFPDSVQALNVAFDTSTALELLTFLSDDHQEALRAMREKRAPEFRGR